MLPFMQKSAASVSFDVRQVVTAWEDEENRTHVSNSYATICSGNRMMLHNKLAKLNFFFLAVGKKIGRSGC